MQGGEQGLELRAVFEHEADAVQAGVPGGAQHQAVMVVVAAQLHLTARPGALFIVGSIRLRKQPPQRTGFNAK